MTWRTVPSTAVVKVHSVSNALVVCHWLVLAYVLSMAQPRVAVDHPTNGVEPRKPSPDYTPRRSSPSSAAAARVSSPRGTTA